MISNPKYGWCDVQIGDFKGVASYLTDVPVELLECFISYFQSGRGVCWFDEEGSEFTLVLNPYSTYVIEDKEETALNDILIPPNDLARELIADIERDVDGWLVWNPEADGKDEDYVDFRRKQIKALAVELVHLIGDDEY